MAGDRGDFVDRDKTQLEPRRQTNAPQSARGKTPEAAPQRHEPRHRGRSLTNSVPGKQRLVEEQHRPIHASQDEHTARQHRPQQDGLIRADGAGANEPKSAKRAVRLEEPNSDARRKKPQVPITTRGSPHDMIDGDDVTDSIGTPQAMPLRKEVAQAREPLPSAQAHEHKQHDSDRSRGRDLGPAAPWAVSASADTHPRKKRSSTDKSRIPPRGHSSTSAAQITEVVARVELDGTSMSQGDDSSSVGGGNRPDDPDVTDDGILVVDAPDGSSVYIDGRACGRGGRMRIEGMSRAKPVVVRIEGPGYHPWTGTVNLEGLTSARVKPAVKKLEK